MLASEGTWNAVCMLIGVGVKYDDLMSPGNSLRYGGNTKVYLYDRLLLALNFSHMFLYLFLSFW